MNWTIRSKMLAAFSVVMVLLAILLVINWTMMSSGIKLTETARDKGYAGAKLATEIKLDIVQVQQWLTDISATQAEEGFDDGFDEAENYATLFRQHVAALLALHSDDSQTLSALSKSFEAFYDKGKWMAQQYIAGGPESGNAAMEEFDAFAADIGTRLEALVEDMNGEAEASMQGAIGKSASSRSVALIFTVVIIVLTVGISLVLSGMISKPIGQFVEHLETLRSVDITQLGAAIQAMAQGDMTATVQSDTAPLVIRSKDEIGTMAQSLNEILAQTNSTVEAFREMQSILNDLVSETQGLVMSAQEGKLDARGDAEKFQGGYRELVQGINGTLDTVIAPVNEASVVLEKVAARDLTARMTGDYKGDHARIKNSLNTAVENLDESLEQVALGAEQVASASEQISSGSQSIAQGASEQASSLEEVSSSLQEMASMSQQNTANVKETQGISDNARTSAKTGVESMNRLSEAMNKIKASSDETAKIVKTIDEIAFQTNLLALNAAVEAARAGDAGKGFAVVAEEVRNLAQRSAEAARNTADLIEGSVKNAEDGVTINEEVLGKLGEINGQIGKVNEVMGEIAAASDQQSQGVEQVNTAVDQMNQVTQQSAANSEESASAAEELTGQAEEMRNMVAGFTLTNGAGVRGRARVPAPAVKQPERVLAGVGVSGEGKGGDGNGRTSPVEDPKQVIPLEEDDKDVLQEF